MWGSNNKIEDSSSTIESVSTASLDVTSRNVVMDITKQLYKNMDLQRISLPTFFLEPRSLLERITDSLSHPDLLIGYVTFFLIQKINFCTSNLTILTCKL